MIIKKTFFIVFVLLATVINITVWSEGNTRVYVNGNKLDGDVFESGGKTYVSLRTISEAMGAKVAWDETTNCAYITYTEDDYVSKIVENVSPSVVAIIGNYAQYDNTMKYSGITVHGTGVIYKSNGYIVTNAHVVNDIKNLTVVLSDGTVLPGTVLFSDEKIDLAVVKVNKIGLTPITYANMSDIVSGRTAIAIGTPLSLSMRNTVTKGIISGVDVSLNDSAYKLIQTDATINAGNSGGPLLNSKGELIGINSSKFAGVGIDNVGFSIPVDTVRYAINQFETYGKINRADLKMTYENSWEAKIGLPTEKGVTVKSSQNGILVSGDIITSINGIEVHSIDDITEALKDTYNNNEVTIKYTRNNTENLTTLNN